MEFFLQIVLALFLPPLAVVWKVGFTKHFWINLICAIFLWVPAILHALWVVVSLDKPDNIYRT